MNKATSRGMFLGDLFVISIAAILLIFRSSYEPKLIFDVSVAVFPFLVFWILLAQIGGAYNLHLPMREFMKINVLLWFTSVSLSQITRFNLKYVISSEHLAIQWIVIEAIGISILFIVWKYISYFIFKILSRPDNRTAKRATWLLIIAFVIIGILSLLPFVHSILRYSEHIYSVEHSPFTEAALVLGAGLWSDGEPSSVMIDRVQAAAELFRRKKIQYIVLSGESQETEVMLHLAESLGLDTSILLLDYSGESTLDSCINMIHNFGFTNVTVISQKYHLYRALYFCDSVGIRSVGVISESRTYLPETIMHRYLREVFATAVGFIKVQSIRMKQ